MQTSLVKEKLLIDGEWVKTDETHKIYNKYTGELFLKLV